MLVALLASWALNAGGYQRLTIVYGADRRGEVAPCHCDTAPLGGVDRQVGYLEKLRQDVPNLLVLDGGDNFFPEASATELERVQPRAELIADALARIRPAVSVPGERDFAAGIPLWKDLGVRARATWLISNLAVGAGKLPPSIPFHFADLSGQRVLVLGLVAPQSIPEVLKKDGFKVDDAIDTAKRLVNQHKDTVDLIVIVAHTGGAIEESLAEKIDTPLLILSAHEGRLQFGARSIGKSQIVSANHSGKYLVRLDLHYKARQPLVAGMQVQKYMRERTVLEREAASQPATQPVKRAKLDADPLWTEQSTLFFQLIPMDRETPSAADLRARAKAFDPIGYDTDEKR